MIYQRLTQIVKLFQAHAQFQGAKSLKGPGGGWLLRLEFFPGPQNLYIFCENGQIQVVEKPRAFGKDLDPSSCPMILYLKAHFMNQRLAALEIEESEGALKLDFHPSGSSFWLKFGDDDKLDFKARVAGRKDFQSRLKIEEYSVDSEAAAGLAQASASLGLDSSIDPSANSSENLPGARSTLLGQQATEVTPSLSAAEIKQKKLLANIRGDLAVAESWLQKYSGFITELESEPGLWSQLLESLEDRAELARGLRAELGIFGEIPQGPTRKASLDRVFQLRKRALRKLEGAKKRLGEIQKQGPVAKKTVVLANSQNKNRQAREREKQIGGRTEIDDGKGALLIALYGRNAEENADLFRQAGSRDLWFHVRGYPGGHVWVPRGQPLFGAKSDPSEFLIQTGCQLALFNSKVSRSGSATVDYTERRFLKASRSAGPGQLSVQRSETRFVKLDAEFERKLQRK